MLDSLEAEVNDDDDGVGTDDLKIDNEDSTIGVHADNGNDNVSWSVDGGKDDDKHDDARGLNEE